MLQPGRAYAARSQDDQAVAAVLDSLVAATYFDDSHFRQWKDEVPNGFSPTFIPQFDDETYAERIAELNRRTPIRLTYNEHVKNFIKLYAVDKRVMTAKILGLTKTYFPLFEQKLREYNMPTELKYLAIVESALNPVAVSSANAKGLWQFIYGTGKMYGLKSTSFVEDRFDPYKATVAACEHMTDLYDIYGDWFLVLAAYNAGAGNVNKAIRRSGGRRDYWGIWSKLPSETRSYVPAFIAVTYVMNYYKEHNIIPEEPGYLYENIATVNVSDVLAFDQIHEVLGIPLQDLEFLNPQYKRGVIPVIGPAPLSLRLPDHYVDDFKRKEKKLYAHKSQSGIDRVQLLASVKEGGKERKIHRVRRGETLASIARMHRCYVSQLIKWNNLRNSRIYPGQKLSVFGAPETIRRASKPSSAPSIVYHKVRRGESLIRIAKRYKVSVSNLASWNNLGRRRTIYAGSEAQNIWPRFRFDVVLFQRVANPYCPSWGNPWSDCQTLQGERQQSRLMEQSRSAPHYLSGSEAQNIWPRFRFDVVLFQRVANPYCPSWGNPWSDCQTLQGERQQYRFMEQSRSESHYLSRSETQNKRQDIRFDVRSSQDVYSQTGRYAGRYRESLQGERQQDCLLE